MIFKPVLIAAIVAGRKTVTRRPVKGRDAAPYEPGKVYRIQPGMARTSVASIRVTDVSEQALGDIDDVDAAREGFADAAAFRAYWRALYGGMWDCGLPVYRIAFELVDQTHEACHSCGGAGYVEVDTPTRGIG